MAASALDSLDLHPGPWTEEELLAQPPNRRVELLDGSLLVSPAGIGMHQWLSSQLWLVLNTAAPRGLRALEAVNLRVAPGGRLRRRCRQASPRACARSRSAHDRGAMAAPTSAYQAPSRSRTG